MSEDREYVLGAYLDACCKAELDAVVNGDPRCGMTANPRAAEIRRRVLATWEADRRPLAIKPAATVEARRAARHAAAHR